ncbi:SDR family oxidoreductase [Pseudomonas sp. 10B1]|uniref:SDR family oxidoreductase n=1 Tax=unclassified Pseudomonas TaxID=196821 RepID=UPI002B225C9B|nr:MULTISPECIES: SDR family oxidoreductase [unclassified Pseudomonas]MEA9997306.1 SDR family oxidoreductase [Pseudomonas sp. AA4]MEB0086515.1 SDR family oxidoreductase [Pseudomonas sp. RTI1]MEB0128502.1 SDR family oxidoreductase [Pseudomonas sp. CCC1.2]MEB0155615.1 SDR family oxidoreductase [Pseudomonas sp. CCC4.3]MEB0221857.1 SDR family oxidoreductase [Pseudomonas sp. AB12(2023)]
MSHSSLITTDQRKILVLGGYGVSGTAVVDAALAASWPVVTASRRAAPTHLIDGRPAPTHISVDLLNKPAIAIAFRDLIDVTDVVYCAYVEKGNNADAVAPNVDMLANALDALLTIGAKLQHVVLFGGGKAYGPHLGAYKTPAKESDPRILGPMFYYDQEDFLKNWGFEHSVPWTVLRPDGIFGPSLGSPMNLVNGLTVYAAICRELNVPLRFPGNHQAWNALAQSTDAGVLGRATLWSLTAETANGEVFNVINGDQFRWSQLWPELGVLFDMPVAEPQPMSLTEQMADKAPVWQKIIKKYGLKDTPWTDVAAWPFLDAVLNIRYDMVQSTIKIRQAGFHDCIDSHESLKLQVARLREARIAP